jgi:hypothetical protein
MRALRGALVARPGTQYDQPRLAPPVGTPFQATAYICSPDEFAFEAARFQEQIGVGICSAHGFARVERAEAYILAGWEPWEGPHEIGHLMGLGHPYGTGIAARAMQIEDALFVQGLGQMSAGWPLRWRDPDGLVALWRTLQEAPGS